VFESDIMDMVIPVIHLSEILDVKDFWSTMGRFGAAVAGTDPCSTGGHPKT